MVLSEFGTQQIREVLRKSMAASAYFLTDGHIEKLVPFLFRNHMVIVMLMNGSCFLQRILELNRRNLESPFVSFSTPIIFKVIFFFHDLLVCNEGSRKRR